MATKQIVLHLCSIAALVIPGVSRAPVPAGYPAPATMTSSVRTVTVISTDGRTPLYVVDRSATVKLGTKHGITHYQTTSVISASLAPTTATGAGSGIQPMGSGGNCPDDPTGSAESCISYDYYQQTSGGRTYTLVSYYAYKWLREQSGLTFTSASGLAGVWGPVLNSSRTDNKTQKDTIGTPVEGQSYTENLSWGSDYVATDGANFQCANSTVTLHHGGSSWTFTRDDIGEGDCSL